MYQKKDTSCCKTSILTTKVEKRNLYAWKKLNPKSTCDGSSPAWSCGGRARSLSSAWTKEKPRSSVGWHRWRGIHWLHPSDLVDKGYIGYLHRDITFCKWRMWPHVSSTLAISEEILSYGLRGENIAPDLKAACCRLARSRSCRLGIFLGVSPIRGMNTLDVAIVRVSWVLR